MKLSVKILVAAAFLALIILRVAAGYVAIHRLGRPAAEPQRVEILSVDEEKQTLTARDKQTGRVFSIHFGEAKDGVSIQTGAPGEAQTPAWVPRYPGSSPQNGYTASAPESLAGAWHFRTTDSTQKVLRYYVEQFKTAGMKVTESGAHVIGDDQAAKR